MFALNTHFKLKIIFKLISVVFLSTSKRYAVSYHSCELANITKSDLKTA
jgi:hypothetical protein